MRWGLFCGYPLKSGGLTCASVKKATGRVDPMCSPNCAAAPADMMISSMRVGSARRPCTTVTRSVEKYSSPPALVLPSSAGGASPGTSEWLCPRTCMVPAKPMTSTAFFT